MQEFFKDPLIPSTEELKQLCINLRRETGYGLMDCRNVLKEYSYDIKSAKEMLSIRKPFKLY